jgi:uncharacterized membrane protein YgdD (TMEM256/DUF423 family)
MNAKQTLIAATVCAALAVAIGAFGAHWLPNYLARQNLAPAQQARQLDNLEIAARYQFYHALALLALGLWLRHERLTSSVVGPLFLAGILLFSGGLYVYAVAGIKSAARIVPIGGVCFIVAWISWAVQIARRGA